MKRGLRTLWLVCAVIGSVGWSSIADAANTIVIPSGNLGPGQAGVQIPALLTNDVTIRTVVAPFVVRTVSGGAFITSLKIAYADRLPTGSGQPLSDLIINNIFLNEDGTCKGGQPGGFGTIAFSDTMPHAIATSPVGLLASRVRIFGATLPPGTDATGSIVLTVDVNSNQGYFEVDSTCANPANHLLFIDASNNNSFAPDFTKGLFAIGNPPIARDTSWSVAEDGSKNVAFLPAYDLDLDPLTFAITDGPFHGDVTGFNPNTGAYTYTPDPNYNGPDSLSFQANDGTFPSNIAKVRITVTPVNDPPVALDTAISTNEDTPVIGNFQGYDIDTPGFTYVRLTGPFKGSFTGFNSSTGAFTYTPQANYSGPDSIYFQLDDGPLNSNVGLVRITVNPINDPPVARDSTLTTILDTPIAGRFYSTDPDGGPPTYTNTGGPFNGILSGFNPATGDFTYTPNLGYFGPDSIKFTAFDGFDTSNEGTIRINVTPSNCICACWADTKCDGLQNAIDLAIMIQVVYFGDLGTISPFCPTVDNDINCDCLTDVVDVAIYIDYIYFGGSLPCDPCTITCQ